MRITGYILLTLGFLWLAIWLAIWREVAVGAVTRGIVIENTKRYSDSKTYTNGYICGVVQQVLIEYGEKASGVVIPSVLMLLGGFFLDAIESCII